MEVPSFGHGRMSCRKGHEGGRDNDGTCLTCRKERQTTEHYRLTKNRKRRQNANARDAYQIQKLVNQWQS